MCMVHALRFWRMAVYTLCLDIDAETFAPFSRRRDGLQYKCSAHTKFQEVSRRFGDFDVLVETRVWFTLYAFGHGCEYAMFGHISRDVCPVFETARRLVTIIHSAHEVSGGFVTFRRF